MCVCTECVVLVRMCSGIETNINTQKENIHKHRHIQAHRETSHTIQTHTIHLPTVARRHHTHRQRRTETQTQSNKYTHTHLSSFPCFMESLGNHDLALLSISELKCNPPSEVLGNTMLKP